MAKAAVIEGRYSTALRANARSELDTAREKVRGLESSCAGMKKLESIKNELSEIEKGIPANGTTWLCYASVRMGSIMRELSLLEFSAQKKD